MLTRQRRHPVAASLVILGAGFGLGHLWTSAPAIPLSSPAAAAGQAPAPAASQTDRLARLPDALRAKGQAIVDEIDPRVRLRLLDELSREHRAQALDFLLATVEADPSPLVRRSLAAALAREEDPRVRPVLHRMIASDPDLETAMALLESIRARRTTALMQELAPLLDQRLAAARAAGDAAALARLEREQERYISLRRGTMLPAFFQKAPPVFSVKAAGAAVRVLAFGDWGTGTDAQRQTAAAMRRYHARRPFDFAVTLGDNFYPVGIDSPSDPRMKTQYEELYGPLGIKFYTTLGNHDWGHPDSPAAEVLYSQQSASWRMPATYYTFTAGPVQFFALDTNEISSAQKAWLDRELTASRARWKVVYGHHHIYSATRLDNETTIRELLPVLENRADVYLCGHDHNLQHLKPERGVHFFVAGAGGAGSYPLKPYERSLFGKSAYGFAVLEADAARLTVRLIEKDLTELYSHTLCSSSQVPCVQDRRESNKP